ncbi:sensor histidine kinase [Flavobacteriaceae bacterium M23B6Z8]
MKGKKIITKIAFRFAITCVIYFFIKLTMDPKEEPFWNNTNLFYFITAFTFFMITWEVNDWLISKYQKRQQWSGFAFYEGVKILGYTMLITIPIFGIVYYLGIYEFDDICNIEVANKAVQWRGDVLRATLIGFAFSVFNIYYHSNKARNEMAVKIHDLEKEIAVSRYELLKDQISPHFLFNSLNTLTSLMYEDRDLASDFVARLAKCYRYILDNREQNMVSLEAELQFLDAFVFMMDIRHKDALKIINSIDIDVKSYEIPTLSLQMLVENALKHNYFSKEKPMLIEITTDTTKSLVVKNSLNKRDLKEPTTKMGLANIIKRYTLFTDRKIEINAQNGVFEVKLPLLKTDKKTPLFFEMTKEFSA